MKACYKNLSEFISKLDAEGELVRIHRTVSPILEITEITDRFSKSSGGGKAILFENVEGSQFPVLTNAFGSKKRIGLALGCSELDDLGGRLEMILNQSPPESLFEKLNFVPKIISYAKYIPRTKKLARPPCQDVIITGADVDLNTLPVLQCWPEDGGRFITLPVVFTKGLADGKRNTGMYRIQIYDKNTTGMHWHIHKDASHHFAEYKNAGERMEIAVAIGTDPAVTYAATAPLPRNVDEMILAGFIRQSPVIMVKGVTVDIEVPAEAEIVLEGYIDPNETRLEGPFGDHTGYYSLTDEYPVFHVTAITHRTKPVYSATVVGRPPMEDCYLALATERLFLPVLKTVMPEIKDYWMPWEGVFHNIVVVAINKEYPDHAKKIMSALWGMGQMSFSKSIVIVDDEKYLRHGEDLIKYLLNNIDLHGDVTISEGILDVLDHSSKRPLFGSKIGIDATRRINGEEPRNTMKKQQAVKEETVLESLHRKDSGFTVSRLLFLETSHPLILINISKSEHKNSLYFIEKLREEPSFADTILILYDFDINLADDSLVLWKLFNNVDPSRDIISLKNGVLIDATKKGTPDGHSRPWPDDIVMTREIKERVDRADIRYE